MERRDLEGRRMNFREIQICHHKCFLLGLARFVNHDCAPNAVLFDLSDQWTVEAHDTQTIQAGDKITVNYGSNYFGRGNGSCLCKHVRTKGHTDGPAKSQESRLFEATSNPLRKLQSGGY